MAEPFCLFVLFVSDAPDRALQRCAALVGVDHAIDLGGGLQCEDEVPCIDPCARKLGAAVAHARGAAIQQNVTVRGQTEDGEFFLATVNKGVFAFFTGSPSLTRSFKVTP